MTVAQELREWATTDEDVKNANYLRFDAWQAMIVARDNRDSHFFDDNTHRRTFALLVAEAIESDQ